MKSVKSRALRKVSCAAADVCFIFGRRRLRNTKHCSCDSQNSGRGRSAKPKPIENRTLLGISRFEILIRKQKVGKQKVMLEFVFWSCNIEIPNVQHSLHYRMSYTDSFLDVVSKCQNHRNSGWKLIGKISFLMRRGGVGLKLVKASDWCTISIFVYGGQNSVTIYRDPGELCHLLKVNGL